MLVSKARLVYICLKMSKCFLDPKDDLNDEYCLCFKILYEFLLSTLVKNI